MRRWAWTIRLRVALAVWAMAVVLLAVQMVFVLARVQSLGRALADARLDDEIAEIGLALGTERMATLVEREMSGPSVSFIEIFDADGRVVIRTPNIPPEGLPDPEPSGTGEPVRNWEAVDPGSRSGHRLLRLGERKVRGFRVRVAQDLKLEQKRYWALRLQLTGALLAISTLGAGVAYLVAGQALAPARRMAAQAEQLDPEALAELPTTGSRDELDRLAEVLNDLLRRVHFELSRMRRMTADVGHALRTPLTFIRGTLELRANRAAPGEAAELGAILEEVDRLIQTANQLLLLEKLESGSGAGPQESIDLADLTLDLVHQFEIVADEAGVSLDCATVPACAIGEPRLIRQVLANLIDNALRSTPRGGHVDVAVGVSGDRVELSVEDSGPGLAEGEQERVFERFYSRAPGGRGVGLGLAIARAIARAHGGDVRASSPKGARFVLELPRAG